VFNKYTGQLEYSSPDFKRLSLDWPPLVEIDAQIKKLGADFSQTEAEAGRLSQGRDEAQDADRQAYARALRSGDKDPGSKHFDKLERSLEAARRKAEALRLALQDLDTERRTLIDLHREEWRSEVADRLPEARQDLRAALSQMQAARSHLHQLQGVVGWLAEPAQPFVPSTAPPQNTSHVIGVATTQSAPAVQVDQALAVILAEASETTDAA
jgi:hypothetical protein